MNYYLSILLVSRLFDGARIILFDLARIVLFDWEGMRREEFYNIFAWGNAISGQGERLIFKKNSIINSFSGPFTYATVHEEVMQITRFFV